ncbi:TPA: hypothetical protein N0F65_008068 [Lagenidium giganteum]|uniref:Uncharacterized protein n=1 Tax=Lagenidium giganteum TaxID=4803 RepID=A0AAV2YNB9_9STRA|nr:TPA: hypothetical protein N0F65_008068 [Lagenidium giganteum]
MVAQRRALPAIVPSEDHDAAMAACINANVVHAVPSGFVVLLIQDWLRAMSCKATLQRFADEWTHIGNNPPPPDAWYDMIEQLGMNQAVEELRAKRSTAPAALLDVVVAYACIERRKVRDRQLELKRQQQPQPQPLVLVTSKKAPKFATRRYLPGASTSALHGASTPKKMRPKSAAVCKSTPELISKCVVAQVPAADTTTEATASGGGAVVQLARLKPRPISAAGVMTPNRDKILQQQQPIKNQVLPLEKSGQQPHQAAGQQQNQPAGLMKRLSRVEEPAIDPVHSVTTHYLAKRLSRGEAKLEASLTLSQGADQHGPVLSKRVSRGDLVNDVRSPVLASRPSRGDNKLLIEVSPEASQKSSQKSSDPVSTPNNPVTQENGGNEHVENEEDDDDESVGPALVLEEMTEERLLAEFSSFSKSDIKRLRRVLAKSSACSQEFEKNRRTMERILARERARRERKRLASETEALINGSNSEFAGKDPCSLCKYPFHKKNLVMKVSYKSIYDLRAFWGAEQKKIEMGGSGQVAVNNQATTASHGAEDDDGRRAQRGHYYDEAPICIFCSQLVLNFSSYRPSSSELKQRDADHKRYMAEQAKAHEEAFQHAQQRDDPLEFDATLLNSDDDSDIEEVLEYDADGRPHVVRRREVKVTRARAQLGLVSKRLHYEQLRTNTVQTLNNKEWQVLIMVSKQEDPAKKRFAGFTNLLPKVPAYLLQKGGKDAATSPTNGEPVDELRSMPEFPLEGGSLTEENGVERRRGASSADASNAFANKIYRKMGIRQSSLERESPLQRPSWTATGVPSPRSDPSLKARRGSCVATKFGTGKVLDVRLDDGFFIVELVPKSIAYLREDAIVREIKAVVGERVKTRWGLATVENYYVEEDMYNIALDWRWDDEHVWRMKATTKKFEKINPKSSIMQNTKQYLFGGYSTIRDSTSTGYANVVARLNTTAAAAQAAAATATTKRRDSSEYGKVITPYGICTVLELRPDNFFVVKTPCGATAYLHADTVRLQQRRTQYCAGDRVKTPYGAGEIVRFRDEDDVYEVKLDFSSSTADLSPTLYVHDQQAESILTPLGNTNNRLSSIFTMTKKSVFSASATVKASASGGLTTLSSVKAKMTTMATAKLSKPKFSKGERVVTTFGSGFITEARSDRIYEVQLRRLKFVGYFHESALSAFPYDKVTHFVVDGKTIPAPEMPKNTPELKRRQVINAAIKSARESMQ